MKYVPNKFLMLIAGIVLCTGCLRPLIIDKNFIVDGVSYSSKEDALNALREVCDHTVSSIYPTAKSVGGKVLVVTPSSKYIVENGILSGDASNYPQDLFEYLVDYTDINLQSHIESLRRRNIFDRISLIQSDSPETYLAPDDTILIYLSVKGIRDQWYLKKSPFTEPYPIHINKALPGGVERMLSWLDNIENIVSTDMRRSVPDIQASRPYKYDELPLRSGPKISIALTGISGHNLSIAEVEAVANIFRRELLHTEYFSMIDKSQMENILIQQNIKTTHCFEQSCAVEIGKLLYVSKVCFGSFTKLGSKYILEISVADVETGELLAAEGESMICAIEDVPILAQRVARKIALRFSER